MNNKAHIYFNMINTKQLSLMGGDEYTMVGISEIDGRHFSTIGDNDNDAVFDWEISFHSCVGKQVDASSGVFNTHTVSYVG